MGKLRSEVGFWTAVGRLRLADVFSIENLFSVLLGAGVGIYLALVGTSGQRVSLAASYLSVVAALVAIVFAGLALVASLLSDAYLRLLQTNEDGVLGFFRPFLLVVGLQVSTVVGTTVYIATARSLSRVPEEVFFGLISVFFFASCLEIVVLTRSVLMHALLRSRLAELVEFQAAKDSEERSRGEG